jgi:hypothetical protein
MKRRAAKPAEKTSRAPAPPHNRSGKRANQLIVAGILVVAAFLRFAMLESAPPGLCFDEAMNGVNVMEAIQSGAWKVYYEDNNGREGLFINIQGLFVWLQMRMSQFSGAFRLEPWMLRFPSAVFGLLTVLGLYLLVLRVTASRLVSASAALFLATSFWHVNFSRIGFRAISAPCWLVWSLWLLWSGFKDLSEGRRRRGLLELAAAGALYAAGFHSYIAYRVTPVILLFVFAWFAREFATGGRRKEFLAGTGVFLALAILATAPLAAYFAQNPGSFGGRSAQVSALSAPEPLKVLVVNAWKTALMFNFAGDTFWRHNIAGKAQLFLPVGVLFLYGIGLTLWSAASKERRQAALPGIFAMLWLAAGALPVILANENVPHALRGILMAPACCMLAAIGAERAWGWLESRYSRSVAAVCAASLAAVLTWHCYTAYFREYARSTHLAEAFETGWTDYAREINSAPDVVRKYIVVPGGVPDRRGVPPYLYPLAVQTNAFNEKARAAHGVQFVFDRAGAERASAEPGALVFLIHSR